MVETPKDEQTLYDIDRTLDDFGKSAADTKKLALNYPRKTTLDYSPKKEKALQNRISVKKPKEPKVTSMYNE